MTYRIIALLLAFALLLSGCQIIKDEYTSVAPHEASFNQSNSEDTNIVTNYAELKDALISLIEAGKKDATITTNYSGNLSQDYQRAVDYVTKEYLSGSYLVESISHRIIGIDPYYKLILLISYRRSAEDIEKIKPVRTLDNARVLLGQALENRDSRLLLEFTGYSDLDYASMAEEYYCSHITTVMVVPRITVGVYPETGNIRYVELNFDYAYSNSELEFMQTTVDALIESAASSVSNTRSDMEKANTLYSFLSEHRTFNEGRFNARAYALLWQGVGDSMAFSAVFKAMCDKAGLDCTLVEGSKNGEKYYWNILQLSDGNWHVDLFSDNQNGLSYPQFLTDSQMTDYSWSIVDYPACLGAPITPPVKEAAPEDSSDSDVSPEVPSKPPEEIPDEPNPPYPEEPSETPSKENDGEQNISA